MLSQSNKVMGKMEEYDERFSDASLIRRSHNFDKRLSKYSPMSLDFENLEYVVNDFGSPTGRKEILRKINGSFKSNQLTAILGASGSGKTTLLNILAGLFSDGYTGKISFNERPRDMSTFKKLSCYLTQEDYLRPLLTVYESMDFAANLKLDPKTKSNQKKQIIEEILLELGLTSCCDARTECLSGGQRKRFSLALELINNPPVIFLDEPTTGMDCVAATKCMDIVKRLCTQGRMIICSIHQPSKYIFDEFDQVYFLAEGRCIYSGSPSNLVKYLSQMDIICPLLWNPADFLIEIAQELPLVTLQEGSKNGQLEDSSTLFQQQQQEKEQTTTNSENILQFDFPISCFKQIKILLRIIFLQMSRNKKMLFIQFINHLLLGLVTGGLFLNSSRTASKAVENFFFYLTVVMFFIYTHTMTSVLLFPSEVEIFKKEYSNRWYSLRAYYGALILRNVPIMIIYGFIFNGLVYILTAQRMDLYYFGLFSFTTFTISAASEALGTFVGSVFSIMHGSIAAPVILAPFIMLSLYGIGDGERIHPFMDLLTSFSYVRSGFTALCRLMLSNQPPLECLDEDYCHYKDTDLLLRDMGMGNKRYYLEIVYICLFTFVCRVLGYLALKMRTKVDFEKKIKRIISSPVVKKFTFFCK